MFLSFLTQPNRPFCDVSVELLGWTGSGVDLVQSRPGQGVLGPIPHTQLCGHCFLVMRVDTSPYLQGQGLGHSLTRPEHYTELFLLLFCVQVC